jgi:hypothetical protein
MEHKEFDPIVDLFASSGYSSNTKCELQIIDGDTKSMLAKLDIRSG